MKKSQHWYSFSYRILLVAFPVAVLFLAIVIVVVVIQSAPPDARYTIVTIPMSNNPPAGQALLVNERSGEVWQLVSTGGANFVWQKVEHQDSPPKPNATKAADQR